jgi:hypothetical protein
MVQIINFIQEKIIFNLKQFKKTKLKTIFNFLNFQLVQTKPSNFHLG